MNARDTLLAVHAEEQREWFALFVALDRFERCEDVSALRMLTTELADLEIDLTGDCPATTLAVAAKIAAIESSSTNAEVIAWIAWAREEHGL